MIDPPQTLPGPGAPADPRPTFRVAVFGLARKFQRLAEIILRHARHNQYRFVLAPEVPQSGLPVSALPPFDIAMVDMTVRGGPEVAHRLRPARPVVRVGRRCDAERGQDDLLQSGFTLELLRTLNRVVEEALLRQGRAAPWSTPGAASGPAQRPCALVVDDSPTVRRQLAMALRRIGLDCVVAGDAPAVRTAFATQRFDLVFLDIVMPDLDGLRLARAIKRHPTLHRTPVIILTSRSSPLDMLRGALAGCDTYLTKPTTLGSLREAVGRHLGRASWLVRPV